MCQVFKIFADFLRHETLCADGNQFDVVSLLTNIPVDPNIKWAEKRIREDVSFFVCRRQICCPFVSTAHNLCKIALTNEALGLES